MNRNFTYAGYEGVNLNLSGSCEHGTELWSSIKDKLFLMTEKLLASYNGLYQQCYKP
jgi:hypothetical protein